MSGQYHSSVGNLGIRLCNTVGQDGMLSPSHSPALNTLTCQAHGGKKLWSSGSYFHNKSRHSQIVSKTGILYCHQLFHGKIMCSLIQLFFLGVKFNPSLSCKTQTQHVGMYYLLSGRWEDFTSLYPQGFWHEHNKTHIQITILKYVLTVMLWGHAESNRTDYRYLTCLTPNDVEGKTNF